MIQLDVAGMFLAIEIEGQPVIDGRRRLMFHAQILPEVGDRVRVLGKGYLVIDVRRKDTRMPVVVCRAHWLRRLAGIFRPAKAWFTHGHHQGSV